MKTLLLLRHAKSSWDQPELTDFQRPLAKRGRRAAPRVGTHMAETGMIPSLVLCSAARRARETWELLSETLDLDVPVEFREDIYHASPQSLLSLIRGVDDPAESLLLIGHNPAFEELAHVLADTGDPQSRAAMDRKFPTGALAVLDFPVGRWTDVGIGGGHLRKFVRPKDLP
jgi:phosphohistidine phosphatase